MTELALTVHAVDRFVKRWRPGVDLATARLELEELALAATPTKSLTVMGDARVYSVLSTRGETILLAVRDRAVITVLGQGMFENGGARRSVGPDQEALDEHALEVAEIRALSGADFAEQEERRIAAETRSRSDQRRSAAHMLKRWKAGDSMLPHTIERACKILGVPVPKRRGARRW